MKMFPVDHDCSPQQPEQIVTIKRGREWSSHGGNGGSLGSQTSLRNRVKDKYENLRLRTGSRSKSIEYAHHLPSLSFNIPSLFSLSRGPVGFCNLSFVLTAPLVCHEKLSRPELGTIYQRSRPGAILGTIECRIWIEIPCVEPSFPITHRSNQEGCLAGS